MTAPTPRRGPSREVTERIRAETRHGVARVEALRRAGVSQIAIKRRVRSGELVRTTIRGVLLAPASADRWTPLVLSLARSRRLAGSHRIAAAVYGWDGYARPADDVLADPDLACPWTSRKDLRPYRRRDLTSADVQTVGDLRVTRPLWTLATLDERSGTSIDRLEQAVECALRRNEVHEDQLWSRASGLLRDVLERRGRGTVPTGSRLETIAVQRVLRPFGLRWTLRQVEIYVRGDYVRRVDFLLPGWVVLEVDGPGHDRPGAWSADRAGDARLAAEGLSVVRAGDEQIGGPGILAQRLRHIVAAGQAAHGGIEPMVRDGRLMLG